MQCTFKQERGNGAWDFGFVGQPLETIYQLRQTDPQAFVHQFASPDVCDSSIETNSKTPVDLVPHVTAPSAHIR